MDCPSCTGNIYKKAGIVKDCQRYQCKGCKYYYTVERRSTVRSLETRRLALELYLEGMGFRAIGRVLKVSFVTVYYWIRNFGAQAASLQSDDAIKVVELDEMHTYIGQKKTTVGYGLLLIDLRKNTSLLCVDAGEQ